MNEQLIAKRLTGWTAILGAIFACLNPTLVIMAVGDDTGMLLHGATVLALPPDTRNLYRWAMLVDILGFYLPFVVIGAYLWRGFRDQAGVLGDIALLAIALYAVFGIAGASMQQAAINPLAHLHAGGDDTVKAATEAAWTALANAVQNGLWWAEGPVLCFWGLTTARQLKKSGWGWFSPLLLKVVAYLYALFFVLGFFPELGEATELLVTVAVLAFPLWMLIFGWQLLRRPIAARSTLIADGAH